MASLRLKEPRKKKNRNISTSMDLEVQKLLTSRMKDSVVDHKSTAPRLCINPCFQFLILSEKVHDEWVGTTIYVKEGGLVKKRLAVIFAHRSCTNLIAASRFSIGIIGRTGPKISLLHGLRLSQDLFHESMRNVLAHQRVVYRNISQKSRRNISVCIIHGAAENDLPFGIRK